MSRFWYRCFLILGMLAWSIATSSAPKLHAASTRQSGPEQSGMAADEELAATPPMGWNSWDGYGTTITEDQFKANAVWFAKHLRPFGWQYLTIDMEWFVTNPTAEGNSKASKYSLDRYGRYIPAVGRFPSSGGNAGFKPLADYVHSLGLKFGIHILRGIPKQAVEENLPIQGSPFHAEDAADTSDTCPWNPDNFGLNASNPAAQAYYDSIARLYADWRVDLIKVDCVASHPYKEDEIRMFSEALRKTGRAIVLSLSPGPAPIEKIGQLRRYAQMWRISDDIWDIWHSTAPYPQGLGDQFQNVETWAGVARPGHWPDADMLPLGYLGPAPGWGQPRYTRLSHDEQRTLMTLWCIFPSPLMIGGSLPLADAWTVSLLTNPEVLGVDQHSTANRPVINNGKIVVWRAESSHGYYLAAFDVTESSQAAHYDWKDLGLPSGKYKLRDLWAHKELGRVDSLSIDLRPHASALFSVVRVDQGGH